VRQTRRAAVWGGGLHASFRAQNSARATSVQPGLHSPWHDSV
jgi:hypothetical protein